MRTYITRFILSIILIIISAPVIAQNYAVNGTVYDENNNPISGVSVSDKTSNRGIISSPKGTYRLRLGQSTDSSHVEFKLLGYRTIDIIIPKLKENIELNLMMEREVNLLDSVIISGSRHRQDYMHLDIYASESRVYFLNRSVEGMISMMPGVSSTSDLSSQYQVRGGNFDENLIYVNGIEVYRPLLVRSVKQEGISLINPSMVSSVSFSTGGFGAEYGDKTSSVLDIKYKSPERFEGRVAGSLMDADAYIGSNTGKFSQMTSIRYKTTESVLKSGDTKAEYKPSFLDFQTYMNYYFSTRWKVSLWGNYAANSYKYKPRTRNTSFGTLANMHNLKIHFNGQEDDRFRTSQGALKLTGLVSDNLELDISGSIVSSYEREEYDITGRYRLVESGEEGENLSNNLLGVGTHHEHARNKLDLDIYRISQTGKWTLKNHQVKWGLEFSAERFTDRIREWEMRDSTGHSIPNNEHEIDMYYSLSSKNKLSSKRFSGYIQDRWNIHSSIGLFTLVGGARLHYWDFNKDFFVSPRLYLRYIPQFNERLAFHISGGLYYQAPFYKEYQGIMQDENGNNIVFLNKEIKPQKSIHFILGQDLSFKMGNRNFRFSTELYYKHLSDMIPYTVNNVKIRYSASNIAKGYIAGLDLRLYGELVAGTTSWISFSLMKTEQKIGEKKAPLPTDQKYMLSAYLEDYMPGYNRLKVGFKGSISDGLPFTIPQNYLTDGYFRTSSYKRADVALSWEVLGENYSIRKRNSFVGVFRNIWLGMEILNLFDAKNVSTQYWVSDVYSNQFAVPNYHAGRKFNFRIVCEF